MKNIVFCLFNLIIISCNSVPQKVGEKEKSTSDFIIYDITTDTVKFGLTDLKQSKIIYTLSGKIKNTSDKTFVKARFDGQMTIRFDNKTIIDPNDYVFSWNNKDHLKDQESYGYEFLKDNMWKPNEAYSFTFKTSGIDKIYSNYVPNQIEYLLLLKAEDPVGYVFNGTIFHKDLKSQWVFKK